MNEKARELRREYLKKYREDHKEQFKEYQKKYIQSHRNSYNAYQKEWRKNNKEKIRQYTSNYWNKKTEEIDTNSARLLEEFKELFEGCSSKKSYYERIKTIYKGGNPYKMTEEERRTFVIEYLKKKREEAKK